MRSDILGNNADFSPCVFFLQSQVSQVVDLRPLDPGTATYFWVFVSWGGFTNIVTHFKNPDASKKLPFLKDIYYTAPMKYKGSVTPALEGPNADVATEFVEVQVPNEFRSTNGPMSRGCRIF